jgi:hypothetical protein
MNDMERRKFEDSFQQAFKDAEASPSENVWTNIELDLEKAEGDKMKRRILFFKTLAAASVVFALCVTGIGYYVFQDKNSNGNLAQRTKAITTPDQEESNEHRVSPSVQGKNPTRDLSEENNVTESPTHPDKRQPSVVAPLASGSAQREESSEVKLKPSIAQKDLESGENRIQQIVPDAQQEKSVAQSRDPSLAGDKIESNVPANEDKMPSTNVVDKIDNEKIINQLSGKSNAITLIKKDNNKELHSPKNTSNTTRKLPPLYQHDEPELQFPVSTTDPGMLLLAKLVAEEQRYAEEDKEQKKNKSEQLWTSVGFAAGGFNANNPNVTPPQSGIYYSSNSASNTAAKQSNASGVAYSFGVSVGAKLSDRWVLQGGVNYLTQSSDYTANSVVVVDNNFEAPKAESLNTFSALTADASTQTRMAQTFPYNVNNNVQFVSVPLQAGYLVINKKFGLQLNAGVSTDLFLQNTITPDGGGLTKTTQSRGGDSPYRSLNFSGLMGTELSYKLGHRYRVALNPGLRYPFSSVYKANTGVDATPLTFDVGLRFRYIFH